MTMRTSIVLLGLLQACSFGNAPPRNEIDHDTVVFTLLDEGTTQDDVHYRFIASDSGEMSVTLSWHEPVSFIAPTEDELSFTGLFERLESVPASATLKRAEERADALGSSTAEDLPTTTHEPGTSSVAQQRLGTNAVEPVLHETSDNPHIEATGRDLQGAMSAVDCYTRVRAQFYADGAWHSVLDEVAEPGKHLWHRQHGEPRPRRFEVLDNDGCDVQFGSR